MIYGQQMSHYVIIIFKFRMNLADLMSGSKFQSYGRLRMHVGAHMAGLQVYKRTIVLI